MLSCTRIRKLVSTACNLNELTAPLLGYNLYEIKLMTTREMQTFIYHFYKSFLIVLHFV